MELTKDHLVAVMHATRSRNLRRFYLQPGQPIVVGYTLNPETGLSSTIITPNGVVLSYTTRPEPAAPGFSWLVAEQDREAVVVHQWTDSEGITHNFFAIGSTSEKHEEGRAATSRHQEEWQVVWLAAHLTGEPIANVHRVGRRVSFKNLVEAFRLAKQVLAENEGDAYKANQTLGFIWDCASVAVAYYGIRADCPQDEAQLIVQGAQSVIGPLLA